MVVISLLMPILLTLFAWEAGLVRPSDTASIVRIDVFSGCVLGWWIALRINDGKWNLWSYILPLLAMGGFIGAGIGLYNFGGHAMGLTDRNAISDQDGKAFLTGCVWGALASIPVALIIAVLAHAADIARERRCRAQGAEYALERARRELADKAAQQQAADTLAQELDAALRPKPYLAFDRVELQKFLRGRKN
jgi:hypothetical protein